MEGEHPESSVFGVVQWNKQKGNLLGCLCVKGDKKPAFPFKASQPSTNSLGSGLEFKGNRLVFALTREIKAWSRSQEDFTY